MCTNPLTTMSICPPHTHMNSGNSSQPATSGYRALRLVFITGLALSFILYLVPCYTPTGAVLTAWTANGGIERRLSSFDLCRLLIRTGDVNWGAFYIGLVAFELTMLVLAIWRPRRWVFLAGSCEQLYLLFAFLLRSHAGDLPQPLLTMLLGYASWPMCLIGFFVKPPQPVVPGAPPTTPTAAIAPAPQRPSQ